MEQHEDGINSHYRLCLKLNGVKRWKAIKDRLRENHGIAVNFSDHDFHLSAYRYINKSDDSVVHSVGHPDLKEASFPRTKSSMVGNRRRSSVQGCSSGPSKKKRLEHTDIAFFCEKHSIKDYDT